MDFKAEFEKRARLVNSALEAILPGEENYPQVIHRAMRYSVLAGGKRLRPVMAMAAAEAVGGDAKAILPAACALELIHTYSLIHDDLPAMDNDSLRRGKPTNHVIFGEAVAILAGDALLAMAFEVLAGCGGKGLKEGNLLKVIREVAAASGAFGLVGGQVADIESGGGGAGSDTLDYIHRHKTGDLFRTSVRLGALLAGAGDRQLELLSSYADSFGMAFQITDDILDIVGDEKKIGKPTMSDIKNNKLTYPFFYGLEESRSMALKHMKQALGYLGEFDEGAHFLRMLVTFVVEREH